MSDSQPVIFSTSTQHTLPPSKYLIPTTWARFQLSQLINKALELPQPVPFDFLIRGQLLRGTIAEWCKANDVKEEETLEIEYFESLMPPKLLASIEGEEWVGSVDCKLKGYILTASYDGIVRVYDQSQKILHSIGGHAGAVTTSCWISSSSAGGSLSVLSGSHDGTAQITPIPHLEQGTGNNQLLGAASLRLHTSPVASVAANPGGTHVLTAGWDGLLGVFSTSIPKEDEVMDEDQPVTRKKRRKVETPAPQPKRKAPIHVLRSHTGKVTRGIFNQEGKTAYSCSVDSTIRTWDTELGVCTSTITANNRPMTDITILKDNTTLLAASSDRVVSIYDLRQATLTGPPPVLPHPAFPAALCAHPTSTYKAATGSYDGVVRLWDLRSAKAAVNVFSISGKQHQNDRVSGPKESKKILSLDWANGMLAVGGEAGVELWRVSENDEFTRTG